tara:strand:- start:807 stop:920 length:114 start_codon:yes stop_codon:yes gene_type:complete
VEAVEVVGEVDRQMVAKVVPQEFFTAQPHISMAHSIQ